MGLPKKSQIVEHWLDWLDKNALDWGEPTCWACKRFWGVKYDVERNDMQLSEMVKCWDKVNQLERCHIIPRQFGGSDTVDNLFLMCRECHDKAPNTKSRELFLRWAKQQCWVSNMLLMIESEMKTFGLENKVDEILEITKDPFQNDFQEIKDNLGLHFNKRHGNKLNISTFMAAVASYIQNQEENI